MSLDLYKKYDESLLNIIGLTDIKDQEGSKLKTLLNTTKNKRPTLILTFLSSVSLGSWTRLPKSPFFHLFLGVRASPGIKKVMYRFYIGGSKQNSVSKPSWDEDEPTKNFYQFKAKLVNGCWWTVSNANLLKYDNDIDILVERYSDITENIEVGWLNFSKFKFKNLAISLDKKVITTSKITSKVETFYNQDFSIICV